jgi:putative intracellular protease/amidase
MTKRVLIPLPDCDFDTTEVSIPWQHFRANGVEVTFSTKRGKVAQTDPLLLTGVIFGQLGAKPEAIAAYRKLEQDPAFQMPIRYDEIRPADYDLLLLPGGHAQGMTLYLESKTLQSKVLEFWKLNRPVGAICHGTIVLARTIDPATGKSVVHGRSMTSLTKMLERTAYYLTFWKLGKYYRTYPEYVQDEVIRNLRDPSDYCRGGSINKPFVVEDGNLITARYPVDAQLFAEKLLARLNA